MKHKHLVALLAVPVAAILAPLERERIEIARGWNLDEKQNPSNECRIYIGQHQSLDNNVILVERVGPGEVRIGWTADAVDFNYYDERAKRNAVEAHVVHRST